MSAQRFEINFASLFGAVAETIHDRPAIVQGATVLTYAQLLDRSNRLARCLTDAGLGVHTDRCNLAGYETGQDLLAQYLHNGSEYVEGLFGSYQARVAPFNVNHRYVADELRYLFGDARPRAVQYHASFAPMIADVLPSLPSNTLLLQVADSSGHELLPGALDYEEMLASTPSGDLDNAPSPDDLYVLYTGGTTGMPKGVLWRQADAAVALTGLMNRRTSAEWDSLQERLESLPAKPHRILALAPYMHGASQWAVMQALCEGNTVVIPTDTRRFDAESTWQTVAANAVTTLTIVGDAFARPLVEAYERQAVRPQHLRFVLSGGAAMSSVYKERLAHAIPGLTIIESMGSSETGVLGRSGEIGEGQDRPAFQRESGTVVISEDMTRVLEPGHPGIGWLAASGRVPLGYLADRDKTERTFPVVQGLRVSLPGDRARLLADGRVELLGRDNTTINTGGEKVFAEEVEAVVKAVPGVSDALVCGRPSGQWGSEVVALVVGNSDAGVDSATVVEFCAAHLARYKLPKAVVFLDHIRRTPVGKPDYRWAAEVVTRMSERPT